MRPFLLANFIGNNILRAETIDRHWRARNVARKAVQLHMLPIHNACTVNFILGAPPILTYNLHPRIPDGESRHHYHHINDDADVPSQTQSIGNTALLFYFYLSYFFKKWRFIVE